jgi:lysophospholipase L1-like esterase
MPMMGQRAGRLEAIALLVAILAASVMLDRLTSATEANLEELALGGDTTSLYAEVDGVPIHCKESTLGAPCVEGWRARGSKPLVLWLGNSQLHAVNQLKPAEQTAVGLLHTALSQHGVDLLTFSQPNASLQEHYVQFLHLLGQTKPRILLLPAIFDDTRETGIRSALEPALMAPSVLSALSDDPVGQRILKNQSAATAGDMAALDQTVQESSEVALNDWLEAHSDRWARRPAARGNLFVALNVLRNQIFGITAQTQRRAIPARLELNLSAARSLLRAAAAHQVRVLVYIVPLRSDAARPHLMSEYQAFKTSMEELAREEGALFRDFESIVPGGLWGEKGSTTMGGAAELDFMHFQAGGHKRLAEALLPVILPMVKGPLK